MTGDRICEVSGCANLGKKTSGGYRAPLCDKHRRKRWPAIESSRKAAIASRRGGGRYAAALARQLLRGDQIRHYSDHHTGVRYLLGLTKGDGLTASRTCPDDCPSSWIGWHSGVKCDYRLCIPAHYTAETQAKNLARKAP